MQRARATGFASILAAALVGCASVRSYLPSLPGAAEFGPTGADLHAAVAAWSSSFQSTVAAACDRIRNGTTARDPRRNCLIWQLRMIPLSRQAAFRPDPQEAYVSSLALATAQSEYLTSGEGNAAFGALQSLAVQAAEQIEADAVELGRAFLNEAQLARLQTQVDELVTRHPIRGTFAADALLEGFSDPSSRSKFSWVIDLPMVPFRALSGVSDTAQAVNAFNDTAQEFTDTVADLPQLTRWQLELLLYDAEELEAVNRALAAAESFANGADRISGVSETLPQKLGTELAARLEEARATIAELDAALARAQGLAGPLTHVSDRIGEASTQWTELLGQMEQRDGRDEGRRFDVREYAAAADRIADASREARALVMALRAPDGGGGRELIDEFTWRAASLIVLFFAALAAYRILASRLR